MLQRQSSFSTKDSNANTTNSGPQLSQSLVKTAQSCSLEGLSEIEDAELLLADEAGLTCLHHACSGASGDSMSVVFIERVLKNAQRVNGTLGIVALLNARTKKGGTAFHFACNKGLGKTAKLLAAQPGFDAAVVDSAGRSALHFSLIAGHNDIAEWILFDLKQAESGGATRPSEDGTQAAHFASLGGHVRALELLNRAGVFESLLPLTTKDGLSCLHMSSMKGHLEASQYLTSLPYASSMGLDVKAVDSKNRTPLHMAVVGGHETLVKWLLELGANPKAADADGKTPLLLAQSLNRGSSGSPERVKEYLANNVSAPQAPPSGPTLLTDAEYNDLLGYKTQGIDDILESNTALSSAASSSISLATLSTPLASLPTRLYVKFEPPPFLPGAFRAVEYQLQVMQSSSKSTWGLTSAWKDVQLLSGPLNGGTASSSSSISSLFNSAPNPASVDPFADAIAPSSDSSLSPVLNVSTVEAFSSTTTMTTACLTGLTPSTAYVVRVRAKNAHGVSAWGPNSKDMSTAAMPSTQGAGTTSPMDGNSTQRKDDEKSLAPLTTKDDTSIFGDSKTVSSPVIEVPAIVWKTPTLSQEIVDYAVTGNLSGIESAAAQQEHLFGATVPEGSSDVFGVDDSQRSILHHAASAGQLDVVKWMLRKVSRSSMKEDNEDDLIPSSVIDVKERLALATAFLLAVVGGHLPVVKYLASRGASIDIRDANGLSALHYAVLKRKPLVLRWLCEAGADVNVRTEKGGGVKELLDHQLGMNPPSEDEKVLSYMLTCVGNTDNLPNAPPPATLIESGRSSLIIQLTSHPFKNWAPGSPTAFAYEIQYAQKRTLGLFWSTSCDSVPTGTDIFSDDYLRPSVASTANASGASSSGTTNASVSTPPVNGFSRPVPIQISGLSSDSKYIFQVRAKNARGWGPWSPKSADFSTRAANDKSNTISADLLDSCNATQTAANAIASLGHPNTSFAGSGRTLLALASNNVKLTASILSTSSKTIKAAAVVSAAPLPTPSLLDDDLISVGANLREKEERENAEKAAVASAVDAALKRGAAEAIQSSRAASLAQSKLLGKELQSMYESLSLGDASSVKTAASRDEEGRSLAHLAAAAGDEGMFVLYALKKVNAAMLFAKDAAGMTPLHYACAVGAKGVAAWIVSQPGGDVSAVTKDILHRVPFELVPSESGENDWKFLF